MKTEQLLTEHKKGVKAIKYAKKPTPLIGPDALKRKEDQKKKAAVKKVEPMSESTDDEENYYYRVRHQTEKDIELEMPSKAWDSVGPKYATYEEAKAAYENLKNKHTREKFTVTRHPRTSYVGGSPSQAFPEGVAEGKPKGYDSDGNPLGGGYDEYNNDKKSWTVVVDGKTWKTFDDERQAYKAADAIQRKYGKKTRVVSESITEGKIKINIKNQPETAQEKLYKKHQELRKKSGLPDPSEYKKKAAEKQKEIDDMKEAKQPEAPKPRNFVAKNAKTAGAGVHKDAKKAAKEVRGQKHKNKEMAEGMERAVDAKGRTQSQWMKLVKAKYPDAKIQQAKMIDGPCQATLSDGRKLSWTKVQQGVAEGKWDPFTGGDYGQTPRPQRVGQDSQDSNTAEPDEEKDQAKWEAMLDYYGTNLLVQRALEDLYKQTHGGGYHDSATPYRYLATIESSTTGKREKKYFPNKQAAYKYATGTLGYVVSIEKIDTAEDDSDLITLPVMLGLGQQKKKWMLQFPDEAYAQKWAFKHKNVATILWPEGHNLEKEVTEAEMAKIVDYKPGQTATLNTGPGMTTIVDLKKNPTSLTKDPATGKLKLMGPQAQGTPAATSTQASTIKPGDAVEIGKVESISDILRLSGLK
jgi:hypothetical protein